VRRLDALLRLGRTAVLLLSGLLGLALVAVTFNTIRLQILTQRDEIELCRLIAQRTPTSAAPSFISGRCSACSGARRPGDRAFRAHDLESRSGAARTLVWFGHSPAIPDPDEMISALAAAIALAGWVPTYQ